MLKELKISHIILIEQAHISFEQGFTVLSGETGAGKSAIMEALKLVLGAKTDAGLIRHGSLKASVTAVFDLQLLPKVQQLLIERGIESDDPDLLIIQREMTSNGKTRAAINHQVVQLSLLRELSDLLIEIVGQHANHKLFHIDQHRQILDLFGDYQDLKESYENEWKSFQTLTAEIHALKKSASGSLREIESCEREIKEIEEAHLQEGEEETLFEAYSLLSNANERQSAVTQLLQSLVGERGVYGLLTRTKPVFNALVASDPKFSDEFSLYPQILLETEELIHSLKSYESKLHSDPEKLDTFNKRLTLLARFKKKYGATLTDIEEYLQTQKVQLKKLQSLESELEWKNSIYEEKWNHIQELASQLTQERKKCSTLFAAKMTQSLHGLNMKNAELHIEISTVPVQQTGQDKIEFFLHTNLGEKLIALKDSASGGELARVLLALHVLLAGKEKIGTLIFDEIDANIGGTTASMMGENLRLLGDSLQIISITHFPQVAKYAQHHLQIAKSTNNGRTLSQIEYLKEGLRDKELARMAGTA